MKWIILVLLSCAFAWSQCASYTDCIERDCPGSVRSCIDGKCRPTECVVPNEDSIVIREGVGTMEDSLKPYERGINLSKRTKNPGGLRQGILTSLGMEKTVFGAIRTIGIVFLILVGLIFIALVKAEGRVKFMIVAVIILSVIGLSFLLLNYRFSLGSGKTGWDVVSIKDIVPKGLAGDFDSFDTRSLTDKQERYVSEDIIDAREFVWVGEKESKLVALEVADRASLKRLNLGGYLNEEDVMTLLGEKVLVHRYDGKSTYIFDEDRFAFILTADDGEIGGMAEALIGRYPGKPTFSRMFRSDIRPPVISLDSPGNLTNKDIVSFRVEDNDTGISKIRVYWLEGFSEAACVGKGYSRECEFRAGNLVQGMNRLQIDSEDFDSNKAELAFRFTFDSEPPVLWMVSPEGYTNNDTFAFRLTDGYSEVDLASIMLGKYRIICDNTTEGALCAEEESYRYGSNERIVSFADSLGNKRAQAVSFIFDNIAPVIRVVDGGFEVEEGYGLWSVMVNGEPYFGCEGDSPLYRCPYNSTVVMVSVKDRAGNVGDY